MHIYPNKCYAGDLYCPDYVYYCTHIIDAAEVPEKGQAVYAYQVNFQMAVYLCKRLYRRILSSGHDLIIEISRYIEPNDRDGKINESCGQKVLLVLFIA